MFNFLDMFVLFLPFIVYYFQELGFSLGQIAILQSSMAITLIIFEIPSGYVADRLGRKNSLIISVIFQIVSMIILFSATNFYMLILSHIASGIGIAFLSGADSAFLYDTLLVLKREQDYKKIEGKAKFFAEIAVIISAITASLIIQFGIKNTILFTIIGHGVLLFLAFSMKEPERHKSIEKMPMKKELSQILDIIKRSLHNKKLLGLFLYSFILFGVSNTIFLMYQPYLNTTGLPLKFFGFVFAAFSIFTAITALKAHDIEKRLGIFGSLLIMPIFLVLSLIGSSIFFIELGFVFFFFREAVRGFIIPVIGDYQNKIVKSEERATVLSIGGMFAKLGLIVISISFGFIADIKGLKITLLFAGIILLLSCIIIPVLMKNKNNKNKITS